jgi:hypothetical protein
VPTLPPVWALLACRAEPPSRPAEPCAAVYEATVADLGATFRATGTEVGFPPSEAFVERCRALGLSEDQLGCLEPAAAIAEPARCAAALAPVRAELDELAAWFDQHTSHHPGASP